VSSNSGSSTPTKEDLSLKGKLPAATAASGAPFLRLRPTPTHHHFDSGRFVAFALMWSSVVVLNSGIAARRAAVAVGRVSLAVVSPRWLSGHLPLPRERRHPPAPVRFRSSSSFFLLLFHSLSFFFFVLLRSDPRVRAFALVGAGWPTPFSTWSRKRNRPSPPWSAPTPSQVRGLNIIILLLY
jgi:hypothetical protein